jgi:hypothetical protein
MEIDEMVDRNYKEICNYLHNSSEAHIEKYKKIPLFNIFLGYACLEKWLAIYNYKERNEGGINCAFCAAYCNRYTDYDTDCLGCPISEKVGERECEGTPFYSVMNAHKKDERHAAIIKEYEFIAEIVLDLVKGEKSC